MGGELIPYMAGGLSNLLAGGVAKAAASPAFRQVITSAAVPAINNLIGKGVVQSGTQQLIGRGLSNGGLDSLAGKKPPKIGTVQNATKALWNTADDVESMLDGKYLGANNNYFSQFNPTSLSLMDYTGRPADQKKVAGIMRAIKNNEDIIPITVMKNADNTMTVIDGHHRLQAFRQSSKMPRLKVVKNKVEGYSYADKYASGKLEDVKQYLPQKMTDTPNQIDLRGVDLSKYAPETQKSYGAGYGGSSQQQGLFKDSKIKDKRGNLLKLYHGTDADFSEFGDVKTEPGYWFTEDKDYALSHGKNLKTVNLNMVKPLDVTTLNGNNKMWEYAKDCFGTENVSEDDIMSNRFRDYLMDKGYDGIIFDHSGKNTYIAFSPKQIKILNNME